MAVWVNVRIVRQGERKDRATGWTSRIWGVVFEEKICYIRKAQCRRDLEYDSECRWTIFKGVSSLYFVVVLDFGYTMDDDLRSSIDDLAEHVEKAYIDDPEALVLAQPHTYVMLRNNGWFPMERVAKIDIGQSSTFGLCHGGTYHVLKEAKRMIDTGVLGHSAENCERVVHLVAHSLQMIRAMNQGLLMDLILVPHGEMPERLYDTAAQWWCRDATRWALREAIGYLPLKLLGQI